jgi:RNA polymerase sigma-70 factor (ECF subfamily)
MEESGDAEVLDSDLVRETRKGDIQAFQRLFEKYQKRVYNLIYRMVGNEADAADLTQEVFVRVYNSLHLLRSEDAFFGWVRVMATNIVRDHFRKVGRTIRAESLDEKVKLDEGEVDREVEDWSHNPEQVVEKQELRSSVQRAINTLSEEQRVVVALHHIEGMDVKEIAEILHIPVGTVKSRLSRAREDLKRKLGHYVE